MNGVGGKISEDTNRERTNGTFLVCLSLEFNMNKEAKVSGQSQLKKMF